MLLSKTIKENIDKIISIESDKNNSEFILPNTKEEHLDLIKSEDIDHITLTLENERVIGFVILAGLTNKSKNIEFRRIVVSEKGKGYGRISINKVKQYCFETLNCHRLWLDVLETNIRAQYLYQSEGFKNEGKLRDSILTEEGEYKNLIIMSMLETEYNLPIRKPLSGKSDRS